MKLAPRKLLIAAALQAGFGFAALAQTPPPAAPAAAPTLREQRGPMDPARLQERIARREAALRQKLNITPQQEGAWATWTQAMRPPAQLQRPNRGELMNLPTPERIDRMRALRTEHMAVMDQRADATKTFYAALTPQQQKVFDSETARFWRGRHGRHHGPRG